MAEEAGSVATDVGLRAISGLLDKVISNKNKKLAKNILMSLVEYMLAIVSIVLDAAESSPNGLDAKTIPLAAIFLSYAGTLGLFIFIHALVAKGTSTSKKIEDIYSKSNTKPYLDVILELPTAFKHGSVALALFLMTMFVLLVALLAVQVSTTLVTRSLLVSIALAVLQMYRIHGDINEYWVRTRPGNAEVAPAIDSGQSRSGVKRNPAYLE